MDILLVLLIICVYEIRHHIKLAKEQRLKRDRLLHHFSTELDKANEKLNEL